MKTCSGRKDLVCPMNGNYLDKDVLYEGVITCDLPNYEPKELKGFIRQLRKNVLLTITNPSKTRSITPMLNCQWKCGGLSGR